MCPADDPKAPSRVEPLFDILLKGFRLPGLIPLDTEVGPRDTDVLTFHDVVQYFVESRPADPRIAAGALLRQRRRKATRYLQFFLDYSDRPVLNNSGIAYGRALDAARVDEELAAAFADHDNDLLIFR